MLLANREGIRKTSAVIQIVVAAVAGALVVYTIPILAGQLIGTKSVKVLAVHLMNNAAGNTAVFLGTGAAGVGIPAIMPGLMSMNNLPDVYVAGVTMPEVETFGNISTWCTALVAAGTIDVQIEVLILG